MPPKQSTTSQQQRKQENLGENRWTCFTLFACISITIGAIIPVGYNFADLNMPMPFIKFWLQKTINQRYGYLPKNWELEVIFVSIVSTYLLGGIIGAIWAYNLNNKYGRKGALFVSVILQVCAGIMICFCRIANSIEMLYIGRLLSGIACAIVYITQPMYFLEIVPRNLRASAGSFTQVGMTCGVLLGQILTLSYTLGTEPYWHYALSFFVVFVLIGTAPICWMPESPRWLYLTYGDDELAKDALSQFRGGDYNIQDLNDEMNFIRISAEAYDTESMSLRGFLTNPEFRLPLVIVCSYAACQQFSGVYALFYYSVQIYTKGGLPYQSAVWVNLAAGILHFVGALLSSLILLKIKQRKMMLISSMGCAVTLVAMAFSLHLMDEFEFLKPAFIGLVVIYIIFYNMGLGPIPLFIGTEIFELAPRTVAMSIGNFFSWTFNFLISMLLPALVETIGAFCFIPCAIFCVYCFVLTFLYLPDYRGRLTPEVKAHLATGFKLRQK